MKFSRDLDPDRERGEPRSADNLEREKLTRHTWTFMPQNALPGLQETARAADKHGLGG